MMNELNLNYIDSDAANVMFLPSVFDDTLQLLLETHDYFQQFGTHDQENQSQEYRTVYCCEMSRITTRLSSIMAWLMVRKAVFMGKMPAEFGMGQYALNGRDVCLNENSPAREFLPEYMNFLLDESLRLYERVTRLEVMLEER